MTNHNTEPQAGTMTEEAQRIAIATACGWKGVHFNKGDWTDDPRGVSPVSGLSELVPDYLHDLNACFEMEKVLTDDEFAQYENELKVMVWRGKNGLAFNNREVSAIHASAAQRCEAFLRAIGKWQP